MKKVKIENNVLNRNYFDIVGLSLLLCSNYYFQAYIDRYLPVNFNIKIIELLFLFITSLIFFYVYFFLIKKLKANIIIYKIFVVFFLAWIVNQAIQTLFFMSNEMTFTFFLAKTFNLYPEGKYGLFIRIFRFFLPYLFFIFVIFFFYNYRNKILDFIKIFSIFTFCFVIYNEINLSLHFKNKNQESLKLSKIQNQNKNLKVLWFVLDEFDPLIAEEYLDLMPNYKHFKDESFEHKNFFMSAKKTNVSIPAQLMGIAPIGAIVKNKRYYLIDKKKNLKEFKYENTIFSDLKNKGFDSSIFSSFVYYCKVYLKKNLLNKCLDPKYDKRSFFTILQRPLLENFKGSLFIFSPLSKIQFTLNLAKKDNKKQPDLLKVKKEDFDKIMESKLSYESLNDIDGYKMINFNDIENILNDKEKTQLGFFHLMIPHLPSEYAEKKLNLNFQSIDPKFMDDWTRSEFMLSYLINLKYTDLAIKKITDISKKYTNEKDIVIIFSSDHWFRVKDLDNKFKSYPSLFIVNFLSDNDKFISNKKSSGNHIRELISNIFDKKVKNQEDIIEFFKSKNYEKPCVAIECLEGQRNIWIRN